MYALSLLFYHKRLQYTEGSIGKKSNFKLFSNLNLTQRWTPTFCDAFIITYFLMRCNQTKAGEKKLANYLPHFLRLPHLLKNVHDFRRQPFRVCDGNYIRFYGGNHGQ